VLEMEYNILSFQCFGQNAGKPAAGFSAIFNGLNYFRFGIELFSSGIFLISFTKDRRKS
jgi:hypothetical protein